MDAEGAEESIPRDDNRLPSDLALTDALAPPASERAVEDNVMDAKGVDNEQCGLKPPPSSKPRFKGNQSTNKFGRYGKRGGKQKVEGALIKLTSSYF